MGFLAKLSLYPIYQYIHYITKSTVSLHLIKDCIHCQYSYSHKYNQIPYRIQLEMIFIL